jgi:hypothetical protein
MGQMMMCTLCRSDYYLCIFLEIIDNEKIEECDGADNDVYIIHDKRYAIRTYSGLRR